MSETTTKAAEPKKTRKKSDRRHFGVDPGIATKIDEAAERWGRDPQRHLDLVLRKVFAQDPKTIDALGDPRT